MPVLPGFFKPPMPPFSKPLPGTGINWDHPLAKGLVHSFPMNEMKGKYLWDYAHPQFTIGWERATGAGTDPVWATIYKVNGIFMSAGKRQWDASFSASPTHGPTGDAGIYSWTDYMNGWTMHVWWKPDAGVTFNVPIGYVGDGQQNTLFSINMGSQGPRVTTVAATETGPYTGWPTYATAGDIAFEVVIVFNPFDAIYMYDSDGHVATRAIAYGMQWPGGGFTPVCVYAYPVERPPDMNKYYGTFYAFNVWNRALGPREVEMLLQNPLQMYNMISMGGIVGDIINNPPGVTLVAVPDAIIQGQSSTLTWTSTYATTLTIDNGIGAVAVPNGSMVVSPLVNTTYTITATNVYGTSLASATIVVTVGPDPRPPEPPDPPIPPDPPDPPVTPGGHFRLYQNDCELRVKQWGSTESYTVVKPFGGKHFTSGAEI